MDDKRFHDVTTFHRSSVHILLADRDSQTRKEVFELLRRCSYKVTAVESAKHVLEVLRAGGPAVDVILSEVEFPHGKGLKLLKHIMREEKLKQIPVVMMSQRDEMALVVKSLRLGAADYLVKPLRTNELLNLWTHMWRRRRMLGMADRLSGHPNMNGPPLELAFSDTSDSNSGSVDMLSNETAGERRSRLERQVNEDNERDRDDLRSHMSPVLSLSLKPSSDGAELRAKNGYEMLPPPSKPSTGSPAKSRVPPSLQAGSSYSGQNPKRLRGGEMSSAGFDHAPKASPEPTSGESPTPPHYVAQTQRYVPSPSWHPNAPQQPPFSGSSSAPPNWNSSAEGLSLWGAPQSPMQGSYGREEMMHPHGHERDPPVRMTTSMGGFVARRESLPPSGPQLPEQSRLQHAGASSNLSNLGQPPEYHRPPFHGGVERGNEGQQNQEGTWQSSYRAPPYYGEPQYSGMVPSGPRGMSPHYFMPPHVQGGGRDPSKVETKPGGGVRHHSPPSVNPSEERSQGFGEAPSGPFGMPPPIASGMQMPSELLMNPHLALFNLPPGVMPMNLPPGMPPVLAAGLLGQMPFPPFFQSMLNPHMMRPPARVPTPPPQAPQNIPQPRNGFSPPPPTTGVPVNVPVGAQPQTQPQPMWPVLQAGGDRKLDQAERREAALSKFRQKRKDRCFAKKIRYASRKKLAEARPRIKGQFVRQKEGGAPGGAQLEAEEDEEEEELEEEEDDVDEEEGEELNKGAQLPDISSSLNGSNDSQSVLNNESR